MSELTLSDSNGITRLCLNRPEVLNALSPSLLESIVERCDSLREREDVRVVVLEGAGRSFCAGADLPSMGARLQAKSHETADLGRCAADAIARLPQITVAAIHGHCVGGAIVLAAACDVRIASDDARFSIPELDAGIPLAWGGMGHLFRLVGETRAIELVLTCRPFDAAEALQAGFLTKVAAAMSFVDEVAAFAEHTASRPRAVLRLVKDQIVELRNGTFDPHADADALLSAFHDPEAQTAGQQYVATRITKTK